MVWRTTTTRPSRRDPCACRIRRNAHVNFAALTVPPLNVSGHEFKTSLLDPFKRNPTRLVHPLTCITHLALLKAQKAASSHFWRGSRMLSSKLGSLLRRSKTLTLVSHLKGSAPPHPHPRVSNDPSLLFSSRFASAARYGESSSISRFGPLYGFKSLPKVLSTFCFSELFFECIALK